MARLEKNQIPDDILAFAQEHLGAPVVEFANQAGGFSQGAAARIRSAQGSRAFLKAVPREGFEGTYSLYERERNILAALPEGIRVPRLIAAYEAHGWIALLIEDVEGHHPETREEMLAVLDSLLTLPTADAVPGIPDAAADLERPFALWAEVDGSFPALTPWARRNQSMLREAAMRALDAVRGNDLVHSDLRPDNVLVDADGVAWLVDWPWASRGAVWYDALLFVLDCSLNMEGVDRDAVIAEHPVFHGVDTCKIDAVLAGFAGYYVYSAQQPALEVPQSLRELQFRYAREILGWIEQRFAT